MQTTITTESGNFQIFTVAQKDLEGFIRLTWRKNKPKDGTTLPPDQRLREIQVPVGFFTSSEFPERYSEFLTVNLVTAAKAQFCAWIDAGNLATREYPSSHLLISNIIATALEESAQIEPETITEWLRESETFETLSAPQQRVWISRLPDLAKKNFRRGSGLTLENCTAILSRINDADLSHPTCAIVCNRLNAVIEYLEANAADAF